MDLEEEIRMLEAQVAHDSAIVASHGGFSQGIAQTDASGQAADPSAKPAPRFAHDADDRSIFVGGLPKTPDVIPERVAAAFEDCGPILKCTILRNKQTGELKGAAYIEFASYEAVGRALDTKNNLPFMGSTLTVAKKKSMFNLNRGRGSRGRGGFEGRGRGFSAQPDMVTMMSAMMTAMAQLQQGNTGRGRGRGRGRGFGVPPSNNAPNSAPPEYAQGMLPNPNGPPAGGWRASPFQ